jgi:hypothetical protein
MRTTLLALFVVTLAVPTAAQHPSALDDPIRKEFRIDDPRSLQPCASGIAIDQVARATHVLAGFENTPDCWLSPRSLAAVTGIDIVAGMSARQAFDHVIASMPMFSWKELNSVVVVRPTMASADPNDLLNQSVQPFQASNAYVDDVLHRVLLAATPSLFIPHEDVPRSGELVRHSMTLTFSGGTMLDALNAMIRAHGSAEWHVGYVDRRAQVLVTTLRFPGDHVMAPAALPK